MTPNETVLLHLRQDVEVMRALGQSIRDLSREDCIILSTDETHEVRQSGFEFETEDRSAVVQVTVRIGPKEPENKMVCGCRGANKFECAAQRGLPKISCDCPCHEIP